jgi:hypothetical protein
LNVCPVLTVCDVTLIFCALFHLNVTEKSKSKEKSAADKSLWDSWFGSDVLDSLMDPNKKEREDEENLKKEIKASKRAWRKIREERFQFLDANAESDKSEAGPTDY